MTTTEATTHRSIELADGGRIVLWSYDDPDRLSVSAWDEAGSLIGMASCERAGDGRARDAYVEVTPDHRRRGIGAALLRELLIAASTHGVRTMTWTGPGKSAGALPINLEVYFGRVTP